MDYFIDLSAVKRRELAPGVALRTMWGDKIMMSMVEIAPNAEVPMHAHPNEQAGIVLQGEFEVHHRRRSQDAAAGRRLCHSRRGGTRRQRLRRLVYGAGHIQPTARRLQALERRLHIAYRA